MSLNNFSLIFRINFDHRHVVGLLKVETVTIIITLITFVELKKITVETKPDGTKVCRELCDNPNLNECPEVKCPEEKKNENESKPTVDHDRSCPPPDCLDEEQTTKLYPASDDPAAFYQCPAYGPWEPMVSISPSFLKLSLLIN